MTTKEKVNELIDSDIELVKDQMLNDDTEFLYAIITQVGYKPYHLMTDDEITKEYHYRFVSCAKGNQ